MKAEPLRAGTVLHLDVAEGPVRVSGAWVHKAADDIMLVVLELESKYAEVLLAGVNEGGAPTVTLAANSRTMNTNFSADPDGFTEVTFSDLAGWHPWAVDGPWRYSVMIAMERR
jgi:hypothetical protein